MIKLTNILLEIKLTPLRTNDRMVSFVQAINKLIKYYIDNGSTGNLDLHGTPITSLPNNLKEVGGDLYLEHSLIKTLPPDLKIEGGLYLTSTPIMYLPNNLKVGGDLWLKNTLIKTLPPDLEVEGAIIVWGTPFIKEYINKGYDEHEIISLIKEKYKGLKGKIYF